MLSIINLVIKVVVVNSFNEVTAQIASERWNELNCDTLPEQFLFIVPRPSCRLTISFLNVFFVAQTHRRQTERF